MKRFKRSLDQGAFERLVEDYASGAAAVSNQILGDRALAEDAVQEAFIRVIRKRRQYVVSSPFGRWFYAILRNVCIDMLRRRNRDVMLTRQLGSEIANSAAEESQSDELALLEMLGPGERHVLELRVVHSMSFKEVAFALDISEEAAKKRAQRGLRRLRQKLTGSGSFERRAV